MKRIYLLLPGMILLCILTACGGKKETASAPDCPFTELKWDSTPEDMASIEGEDYGSYDSLYGGLCYTYPKEYEGYAGTVKYMFNDKDELMSVAWAYSAETVEEIEALYDTVSTSLTARYGESGYDAGGAGNYGGVWYLEEGDIVLTTMSTSEIRALQYAYLHPLVSKGETDS
ncbi:MAG: hypothetical protein NC341_05495 [Blautia sp.]|nr:hypothetical protein [Blautia sp.]